MSWLPGAKFQVYVRSIVKALKLMLALVEKFEGESVPSGLRK